LIINDPVYRHALPRLIFAHGRVSPQTEVSIDRLLSGNVLLSALTLSNMVTSIASARACGNPSSAIRLFVLDDGRAQIGATAGTRDAQTSAKDAPALRATR
jgi:hypothetical protein